MTIPNEHIDAERSLQLTVEEARVFGCLIEKSQATPEYYPMTLNSLVQACNQKSSRFPVVNFDEFVVDAALEGLRDKGLVAFAQGGGRALKCMHRAGRNGLELSPAQAAVLSLLLLRGAQTTGELRARSGRQHTFSSTDEVMDTIGVLAAPDRVFVEEAPKRPGQKEIRFRHRFHEYTDDENVPEAVNVSSPVKDDIVSLRSLVKELQEQYEGIKSRCDSLEKEIRTIRSDLY